MIVIKETEPRKVVPAVRHIEIVYDDMIEMVREYLRNQGVVVGDDEDITVGGLDRHQVRHGGEFWLAVKIEEHIETYDSGWPFNKTK